MEGRDVGVVDKQQMRQGRRDVPGKKAKPLERPSLPWLVTMLFSLIGPRGLAEYHWYYWFSDQHPKIAQVISSAHGASKRCMGEAVARDAYRGMQMSC